jgi:hypothetical protein
MKHSLTAFFLFAISGNVIAGQSEITWTEPEKYTDIRPGSESKKRFRNRIFKNFEKHFIKLSEQLPEGQILKLNVTNVDLAGDVRFSPMQEFRIIKDIYIPRFKFTYELLNADKTIVDSGKVDLKDMSFMNSPSLHSKNDTLKYEKSMIDKWFKSAFIN